jgi:sec-independent protein translocase protein TatA
LWYDKKSILKKELKMRIGGLGPMELIIILVIVILLFGPGRIGKVAGELGRSIKDFRDGLGSKEDQTEKPEDTEEKK